MSITDPAELWEAIQHDYVDELRKGQFYVRRELYNVKLEACGSVDKYVTTIQNMWFEATGEDMYLIQTALDDMKDEFQLPEKIKFVNKDPKRFHDLPSPYPFVRRGIGPPRPHHSKPHHSKSN
jgi:hypothetical protein